MPHCAVVAARRATLIVFVRSRHARPRGDESLAFVARHKNTEIQRARLCAVHSSKSTSWCFVLLPLLHTPSSRLTMRWLRIVLAVSILAHAAGFAATPPLPAPKGIVSFEMDCLVDESAMRTKVSKDLQDWLRGRLGDVSYEPLNVYAEYDLLCEQANEFGFQVPGVKIVQREAIVLAMKASGLAEDEVAQVADDGVIQWESLLNKYAEAMLDDRAVTCLQALRENGLSCCAVTSSMCDSARIRSISPLVDFTLCTYEFTVGASDSWGVAFQVAPMKYPMAMGAQWVHVGGGREGGLDAAKAVAGLKTVALKSRGAAAEGASAAIDSLDELAAAIDELV